MPAPPHHLLDLGCERRDLDAVQRAVDPHEVRVEAKGVVVVEERGSPWERFHPRARDLQRPALDLLRPKEIRVSPLQVPVHRAEATGDPVGQPATVAGSQFPPHTRIATRSPGSATYAPDVRAAKAVAPPGSATIRSSRHKARCASRIASSLTSADPRTNRRATPKAMSPTRRGPRASTAMPATATSIGAPASSAACKQHDLSGSTTTTQTSSLNHDEMPAINPPPPT